LGYFICREWCYLLRSRPTIRFVLFVRVVLFILSILVIILLFGYGG
jgi:hypothetical protein